MNPTNRRSSMPSSLRSTGLAFFAGVALLLASAPAMAAFQVSGKPKVNFFAVGTGAPDIEGVSDKLSIADDGTTLTFTVPMESVETGMTLRDHHMHQNYVQVDQFPNATLSFARSALTLPVEVGESTSGSVQASFTVHGVAAPVTVTWSLKRSKSGYTVDASFNYDVTKHGIEIPSYLGVTVDPAQKARVRFEMIDA